jgi:hypothetical protein
MSTWLERLPGQNVYEPVSRDLVQKVQSWMDIIVPAFRVIKSEADRGADQYTPFSERCSIGSDPALWSKLRPDAYATCRHHVQRSLAAILVSSGAIASSQGSLRIFQPDSLPVREYMDDTEPGRPVPTVCYFLRWEWTGPGKVALPTSPRKALVQPVKALPPPLPKSKSTRLYLSDSSVIDI